MSETYLRSHARESIYESAEKAVNAGLTPEEAIQMLREGWADHLTNKQRSDERTFSRIITNH